MANFPYCRATERRVSCAGARLLLTDFFIYARTYYNKLNTRVPWPLRARRLFRGLERAVWAVNSWNVQPVADDGLVT